MLKDNIPNRFDGNIIFNVRLQLRLKYILPVGRIDNILLIIT